MTVEIAGFVFDEVPNTLRLADGSLAITDADDAEQGFMFSTLEIFPFKALFSRFRCGTLSFDATVEGEILQLDTIDHDDTISKLHIRSYFPINVNFRPGRVYFPNLRNLTILWKWPTAFPDLRKNSELRSLTLQYERGNAIHWSNLQQIQDLVIYDFDEPDLTSLSGLTGLVRLKIIQGKMKSLHGVQSLPNLQTLFIATAAKLDDLLPILLAPNLLNLMFEGYRKITDWSFLEKKPALQAISLGLADSVNFIEKLPNIKFLYCKKVLDRAGKKILFSTSEELDKMVPNGITVKYDYTDPAFYQPLETMG